MSRKAGEFCPLRYELRNLLNAPIPLAPNTIEHIYNGGKLRAEFLGESNPRDDYRSEEWIFSTNRAVTPGKDNPSKKGFSKIQMSGLTFTLDLLLNIHPYETIGRKHHERYGAALGVLLKIFDVGEGEQIPIHWHPTPEFAKDHLGSYSGKNEAWIILGIRNEGKAWAGWQYNMPKERFRTLIAEGNVERVREHMHELSLKVGDVLSIPAGVVHSTGSGVCVLEPQEPTDFSITAEYERFQVPEEEAHLGLGWDLALGAASFEQTERSKLLNRIMPPPEIVHEDAEGNRTEAIISKKLREFFWAEKVTVKTRYDIRNKRFHCITAIQGEGFLGWDIQEGTPTRTIPVRRGQSFFIPTSMPGHYMLGSEGSKLEAIRCFPPALY